MAKRIVLLENEQVKFRREIASFLKRVMYERNIVKNDIAKTLNVRTKTVEDYLNEISTPHSDILLLLHKEYDLKVDDLFDRVIGIDSAKSTPVIPLSISPNDLNTLKQSGNVKLVIQFDVDKANKNE